jgi:beta-lactamase regulating signal transducer with metallopeptidase domain/thiol-disulfide isomerase/thioredoxin/protocatechuate 3,4-dioxygenase beta subunit
MSPISEAIVRLAWIQLWQVTLLAGLVALLVRLGCRNRPHLAYVLWLVVLVKCLTPPVWSSPTSVFSWAQAEPLAAVASLAIEPATMIQDTPLTPVAAEPAPGVVPRAVAPVAQEPTSPVEIATDGAASRSSYRAALFWYGVAIWFGGALAYVIWVIGALIYCSRHIALSRLPQDDRVTQLVDELSRKLGVRRRVRLTIVERPIGPLTYGWLRPLIVVPTELARRPIAELEPILAHELMHVRRGDAFVGLLQVAAQALWWFHPLVWLMNRGLCTERERCCDGEVIATLGYGPTQYGRGLLNVLKLKRQWRLPAAVPGIRPFEVTRRRLEYLVNSSNSFRKRMPRSYWLGLLLALVIVLPGAGLIRQQRLSNASPPAAAETNGSEQAGESAPQTDTWTVAGRVVDHRGEPVADAEVVLLGEERIGVEADRRTWFVLRAANDPNAKPKSVRTGGDGEFQIERTGKDANRLAVIGADPVFWLLKRDQLAASGNVEIKLPAPGSIALEIDLPGKPAKQEVNINLRTLDGKDWEPDLLRYHFGSNTADNPGRTVFGHLPPGKYAVERNQSSKLDTSSSLITFADRQLATVEPNQQATVRIDRKRGRPLSGRVVGLEGKELRHALLTFRYFGPEEHPGKNGKPVRFGTAFDVIPVPSSGEFTTDPIPPGEYMLMLSAKLMSSPNQSGEPDDFTGQINVTIPAEGEMPKVELKARPPRRRNRNASASEPKKPLLEVVDEEGKPVPAFEIKVWTTNQGSSPWYNGTNGRIPQNQPLWGMAGSGAVQMTIRAEGFASKLIQFAGDEREALLAGKTKITLDRGREVKLRFTLPEGMTWPEDYLPELYFNELSRVVGLQWNPANRRNDAEFGAPDYNMLNAKLIASGVMLLRLAEDTPPISTAIYAPGFLRYFVRGPFTLASFPNDQLTIDVEKPAQLEVKFNPGNASAEELPFERSYVYALWMVPGGGNAAVQINESPRTGSNNELVATDLAPGEYRVSAQTIPKPTSKSLEGNPYHAPANPGQFHAGKRLNLTAGGSESVEFTYVPLNVEAWRGNNTATLRLLKTDGTPAADREVQVLFADDHYGNRSVYSSKVPPSGEIKLAGLTDRPYEFMPDGPYSVYFGAERAGTFGFKRGAASQEFTFYVPPGVGDTVPNVSLLNLSTGEQVRLESFRGKVVCLEFWASWCGPCREPLEKLNKLAAEKGESWRDQVAIVAVSIDEQPEAARRHLAGAGLTALAPLWSGAEGSEGWESPAAKLFGVVSVPSALILDRERRVLWRGHPGGGPGQPELATRLQAFLGH